jgi:alkylmercury lyase
MSTTQDLVERLTDPAQNGLDPTVLTPLLELLTQGEPVAIGTLAAASGLAEEEIRARLAAVPDTEYDDAGRIVGQGLTLRPTPHRFTVDGQELYTWCALDTLIFPLLLNATARVESVSVGSGKPVRFTASPAGVSDIEPATTVVSLVDPEDTTSIRSSFCDQVHFFTSATDAAGWLDDHTGATVLPVADAYRLATDLATAADQTSADSCATDPAQPPECCS